MGLVSADIMSRIHCELKKGWDMWRAQVFIAFPPAASQSDTIQEGLRPMAMQSSIGVLYETADSMRSNYEFMSRPHARAALPVGARFLCRLFRSARQARYKQEVTARTFGIINK